MYRVEFQRRAKRELDALPKHVGDRLVGAIRELGSDPRPRRAQKLTGTQAEFRIRTGRYRIIYQVDDKRQQVLILAVRIRSEKTYRGI